MDLNAGRNSHFHEREYRANRSQRSRRWRRFAMRPACHAAQASRAARHAHAHRFRSAGAENRLAARAKPSTSSYPKINTVQEYPLGKYREACSISFSCSASAAPVRISSAAYEHFTSLGEESNRRSATLCTCNSFRNPKKPWSSCAKPTFGSPPTPAIPVQQRLYLPSGDFQTMTYTAMKINPKIRRFRPKT